MHILLLLKQFKSILNIKLCKYYYSLLKTLECLNLKTLHVSVPLAVLLHTRCAVVSHTISCTKTPPQSLSLPPVKIPAETYLSCKGINLAVTKITDGAMDLTSTSSFEFPSCIKIPNPTPSIYILPLDRIQVDKLMWHTLLTCYLLSFFSLSLIIDASKPMFLRAIV